MPLTPLARAWLTVATRIPDARLRLAPLAGGTSTTMLAVAEGSAPPRFALRLLDNAEWLAEEPDLLEHEVAALTRAGTTGLPVPEVVAADPGGGAFGPAALLTTFLPGRVELCPDEPERWTWLLASTLARVHSVSAPGFPWRYRSWVKAGNVRVPGWTVRPRLWEAAAEAYSTHGPRLTTAGETTFVHRDYHPLNLLFTGTGAALAVSAVVDWVNACSGPAAADVSHCRMNLALLEGTEAADAFLRAYAAEVGGADYDPLWDLDAVFDMAAPIPAYYAPWGAFGAPDPGEAVVRERVEALLDRALERL
ncbi:MAG: aminoglycoside phosphotransferase family protein [Trueperaceae bacterium]|jgi:aminoglycoside phosphotransferase (APT) family kinase protein|nr:aminoglycoside phosphotransferase family protein [Trueperaceae bacterium]MCO5175279.1 aminoglycoside phosphotransferase family protein [Trueperaceae bacterium]MCW5819034.1 aminoglycoside phosphotransferase family protein [Trueperaceae bacterium]